MFYFVKRVASFATKQLQTIICGNTMRLKNTLELKQVMPKNQNTLFAIVLWKLELNSFFLEKNSFYCGKN